MREHEALGQAASRLLEQGIPIITLPAKQAQSAILFLKLKGEQ
jgi:hypothetical protein